MYRPSDNIRQKDKSPRPPKPVAKPQPVHKKHQSQTSSVEEINDEDKVELVYGVVVTLSQFN